MKEEHEPKQVDGAESDEDAAQSLNAEAVGCLAQRCAEARAFLLHFSTDYVFPGTGDRPWRPDEPVAPPNAYGRTKAAGEALLQSSGAQHLIVRTSWLYAPWGKNFVRTMTRLLRDRSTIEVVNDQIGRPTSAEHLADTCLRLLVRGCVGVSHVTDGGVCTWHGLALEIGRLIGSDCRVEPCTTDAFPRPATRPAYGVLDLSDTESQLGPMPDWRQNLAGVVARLG